MNQNVPDDPLDRLLHQWADERMVSSKHLDDLQRRIVLTLSESDEEAAEPTAGVPLRSVNGEPASHLKQPGSHQPSQISSLRAAVAPIMTGIALSALVTLVWLTQVTVRAPQVATRVNNDHREVPGYVLFSEEELQNRNTLLVGMKELFGNRLNWLAETDAGIDVGLADNQDSVGTRTPDERVIQLAVRIVIEQRSAKSSDWRRVWSVDVTSQSEEVIALAQKNGSTALTLWAYALPDGMIAVDSEFELPDTAIRATSVNTQPLHAVLSNVHQDRVPLEEQLTGSDGAEYRVFQTVAVLEKQVG